jgi:hypothetical protein
MIFSSPSKFEARTFITFFFLLEATGVVISCPQTLTTGLVCRATAFLGDFRVAIAEFVVPGDGETDSLFGDGVMMIND